MNKRSFKQKLRYHKKSFISILKKWEKNYPLISDKLIDDTAVHAWKKVKCLSCANCCKTMTPTYKEKDIKKIAHFLHITTQDMKKKWLKYNKKDKEYLNKSTPCQFLNKKTNKCIIYIVRPPDCMGFPHLTKDRMKDYLHVHQQNIAYCPTTYFFVEELQKNIMYATNSK